MLLHELTFCHLLWPLNVQHPESGVRLVCIDLLGTITSAFMADCKQVR